MLEIRDLTVTYSAQDGAKAALRSVSISVASGEILALSGSSGAGKTTLGLAISGLLPSPARVTSGTITFLGRNLLTASPDEMRRLRGREIASVFQDTQSALHPMHSVGRALTETLRQLRRISKSEAIAAADILLKETGFTEPAVIRPLYPHQMSGGMRQRAVLALAFAGNPQLLIADEPTASLDAELRPRILELLANMARARNAGILLITHDTEASRRIATRSAVLIGGEASDLFSAVPTEPRRPTRRRFPADAAIQVQHVSHAYRQEFPFSRPVSVPVLHDISLAIHRGETLGLIGPSGSGKSTLARIIAGLVRPDQGSISFGASERPARIQMIFQDPYASLNPSMTVSRILAEPLRHRGIEGPSSIAVRTSEILAGVGMESQYLARYPHQLSGGQRQRIAIARSLAAEPDILICDEPTSSLDEENERRILDLLEELKQTKPLTMIVISHDLSIISALADRVFKIESGQVRML